MLFLHLLYAASAVKSAQNAALAEIPQAGSGHGNFIDFNPVDSSVPAQEGTKQFPNGDVQWFGWYNRVCEMPYWPTGQNFEVECGNWWWGKKYGTWVPWYYRACLTGDMKWDIGDQKYCENFYKYVIPSLRIGAGYTAACDEEDLPPALVETAEEPTEMRKDYIKKKLQQKMQASLAEEDAVEDPTSPTTFDNKEEASNRVVTYAYSKDWEVPEWNYIFYYAFAGVEFEDDWSTVTETATSGSAASLVEQATPSAMEEPAPASSASLISSIFR